MKNSLLVVVLIFSMGTLYSVEWPAIGGDLAQSFGQKNEAGIRRDIRITGSDTLKVQPVDDGEVIFVRTSEQSFFPSSDSTTVALEHTENLRSIYYNLESANLSSFNVKLDEAWATPKKNGNQRQFDLAFYDNQKRQFVNPLLFITNMVIPKPAYLRTARLKYIDSGLEMVLENGMMAKAGMVDIFVDAVQFYTSTVHALNPYAFRLEFMGDLIQDIRFDAINSNKGVAYLVGLVNILLNKLYSIEGYICLGRVQLISGKASFNIKVLDTNGAVVARNYNIDVN